MNRKLFLFVSLIALLAIVLSTGGHALASTSSDSILTGYYNLFGHEGIGTVGTSLVAGSTPPVGDYVPNGCRYINVPNATYGQYYLRYPLHLPNGATITKVSAYVADFNTSGTLYLHMKSRPWNSREAGNDFDGSIGTTSGAAGDQTITRTLTNTVVVNNQTSEYWIDVIPQNSANPGQLCVYGIQVTYTYNGAFLPLISR
jgi:hypothetical protein